MFRQIEQGIKDCSGGRQVLKFLLWPGIISQKKYKRIWACTCFLLLSILLLSLFFYSLPPLAVSIHCRLMHLTNHWARKGINSYSKQRAIMGTLVVRKLRIFQPARRYARITEHFYTLFSKHSLGQAWKERGGRDFNWQDMARQGEGGRGVEEGLWGSVPWMHGYRPLLLKQLVHKGLITKWHDDPAYRGRLTMKCSIPSNTPCVSNNVHTNTIFLYCMLVCMHCVFALVLISSCI